MSQQKTIWEAVHAALLEELEFRAGGKVLCIEPNRLADIADNLADVVVGKFEVTPRRKT